MNPLAFQFLLLPMTKKKDTWKSANRTLFRLLSVYIIVVALLLLSLLQACRSQGCRGVPIHPQILADHLTLYQPGGASYARHITTGTPWNIRPSYGSVQLAVPRRRRFLFLLMARTTIWYTLVPSSL